MSFALLTVEWLLSLATTFIVLAKHWAVIVGERGGPYSLIVLLTVAAALGWQWANVLRIKQEAVASAHHVEIVNVAQRGFFVACTLVLLLIVAFGLFLNHGSAA